MANWVKNVDGNLINLDLCNTITLIPLGSKIAEVVATTLLANTGDDDEDAYETVIFCGTPEECGKFRNELYRRIGLRDLHGHPPV